MDDRTFCNFAILHPHLSSVTSVARSVTHALAPARPSLRHAAAWLKEASWSFSVTTGSSRI